MVEKLQDISLCNESSEILKKMSEINEMSLKIKKTMTEKWEIKNKNQKNYNLWNANDLYFWILNIQNAQNQFIFNEYSMSIQHIICLFLFIFFNCFFLYLCVCVCVFGGGGGGVK